METQLIFCAAYDAFTTDIMSTNDSVGVELSI